MPRLFRPLFITGLATLSAAASPENTVREVAMQMDRTANYYVTSVIESAGQRNLLVDTGSGYSTVSQDTLKILRASGDAVFLRNIQGILADGSHRWVSVYRISGLNIGGNCYVKDVEVAVFPEGGREILGLSALGKVSPFTFSIEPPRLFLSNCNPT